MNKPASVRDTMALCSHISTSNTIPKKEHAYLNAAVEPMLIKPIRQGMTEQSRMALSGKASFVFTCAK